MSTRIAKKKRNPPKKPTNSGKDVEIWSVQFAGGSAKCYNHFRKQSQFSSVQSLSHAWFSATPWTAARQVSLSIPKSQSLLKLMSIESVRPSNHLILCCPLLLPPSIFPSIRVFSNESVLRIRWPKYWSFGISPSSEHSGSISFRTEMVFNSSIIRKISHQKIQVRITSLLSL